VFKLKTILLIVVSIVLIFLGFIILCYKILSGTSNSSTYFTITYYIEDNPSIGFCDTSLSNEMWLLDKYHYSIKRTNHKHNKDSLITIRRGSDTLYMFSLTNDTVYTIYDTIFKYKTPNIPFLLPKSALKGSPIKLPPKLTTSTMVLFYYDKEAAQNNIVAEFFIWINSNAHLILYQYVNTDDIGRRWETGFWHAWNIIIPDSLFTVPFGLKINKDINFYNSKFYDIDSTNAKVRIIRKKARFTIPPLNECWRYFKICLKIIFG
jgi:hypothetical protein